MTIPRTATVILLPRRKWSFPLLAVIERERREKEKHGATIEKHFINFPFNHKIITDRVICNVCIVLSTIIET